MKQTAVEWLEEQLFELRNPTLNQIEILTQAKEMEKQQQGYSEEEVLKLLKSLTCDIIDEGNEQFVEEWFEQFKNNK